MIATSTLSGKNVPEPDRWLYFAPPQFEALPPEHQDQLLFLDTASTDAVLEAVNSVDILCGDGGWGNNPFSDGCYKSVEHFKMQWKEDKQKGEIDPEDGEIWYPLSLTNESELKKWLYHRGVAFKAEVLLLKAFAAKDSPVLMTTWKMVVKFAETFFSGDNAIFFDPKLSWCLHYHNDGILHFAKGEEVLSGK
ncbi:MAG TPA: hypothetical protein VF181_10325 [Balneolaceae bacterium]